jgi:surfactin synthase thioesterase subunit
MAQHDTVQIGSVEIGSGTAGGYLDRAPDAADEFRLFCFHHAGGGASAFRGWREQLAPTISVFPIQLPGREGRVQEQRLRDIDTLVGRLADLLDPFLDRPFAFYGHSMGALVAYRLTRTLVGRGGPRPVQLLVGAYPAPHNGTPLGQVDGLTDGSILDMLIEAGGVSETVRNYPRWTGSMVAMFKDDLDLCRSHDPANSTRLPVPIQVFTGETDPLMSISDATGWREHTSASCQLHVIPGGHFFTRESRPLMLATVADLLTTHRVPSTVRES